MQTLPLISKNGHLFAKLDSGLWLIDTGASKSFGNTNSITLAGKSFSVSNRFKGLSAVTISEFVGVQCTGLLGVDILRHFDHIFDCTSDKLTISLDELTHNGKALPISAPIGIPTLTAQVAGNECRMFFDTGAQISYYWDDALTNFPSGESTADFYPGYGKFQTETYQVDISLSGLDFTVCCGILPEELNSALQMPDIKGIIGNQIMRNRVIGYFPRRHVLYL